MKPPQQKEVSDPGSDLSEPAKELDQVYCLSDEEISSDYSFAESPPLRAIPQAKQNTPPIKRRKLQPPPPPPVSKMPEALLKLTVEHSFMAEQEKVLAPQQTPGWLVLRPGDEEMFKHCMLVSDTFPSKEFEELQREWLHEKEKTTDSLTRRGTTRSKAFTVESELKSCYGAAYNVFRSLKTERERLILLRLVACWHDHHIKRGRPSRPKPWIPDFVKTEEIEISGPKIRHKNTKEAFWVEGTEFEPTDLTAGGDKMDPELLKQFDRVKRIKVEKEN